MKKAYSSRAADQRIVEEVEADAAAMCTASGCPNRWTVDFGTRLCGAHSGADPLEWPEITQRLADAAAEAAFRNQGGRQQATHRHFSTVDKKAVGQRLRAALRNQGGRQWAERLRDRELRGERLNQAQRTMWRDALGVQHEVFDDEPADEVAYA